MAWGRFNGEQLEDDDFSVSTGGFGIQKRKDSFGDELEDDDEFETDNNNLNEDKRTRILHLGYFIEDYVEACENGDTSIIKPKMQAFMASAPVWIKAQANRGSCFPLMVMVGRVLMTMASIECATSGHRYRSKNSDGIKTVLLSVACFMLANRLGASRQKIMNYMSHLSELFENDDDFSEIIDETGRNIENMLEEDPNFAESFFEQLAETL